MYYDDLARLIGCFPSFWKLLRERPTAFWHAWITSFQPLQYRLVGPGRLEKAEKWLTELHRSRMSIGKKHGNMVDSVLGYIVKLLLLLIVMMGVAFARIRGYYVGSKLSGWLMQNLQHAALKDSGHIRHAFIKDKESSDVKKLGCGKVGVFKNRITTTTTTTT